jgi:hypothetical protein
LSLLLFLSLHTRRTLRALKYTLHTPQIVLDQRDLSQHKARINILQTIFITLLLGIGAWQFSKDTNESVITQGP